MAHPHNSGLALRIFSKFCRMNERGQQVHGNFISCFLRKKIHLGQFDLFSLFSSLHSAIPVKAANLHQEKLVM